MAATVQQLRTTSAANLPLKLAAGQIAFNLANKWLLVGMGGDDILVAGTALTAYGSTQTILGVPNVTVPAKPVGGGYEIFDLEGTGIASGSTLPAASAANAGQLFVSTANPGKPQLLISNGTAFVPVSRPPAVYSLTDREVHAAAGAGITAKSNAALTTKGGGFTAGNLQSGDELLIATAGLGGPYGDAPIGQYLWDGSNWVLAGADNPSATEFDSGGPAGVVWLARDTDVAPYGAPGSTFPNPLSVPTAEQVKNINQLIGTLTGGVALLGTYDASRSAIASTNATATTRGGFTVGGKVNDGISPQEGDFFIVSKAGTPTGDAASINVALTANDHLVWTGAVWHVVNAGVEIGPVSLHSCVDVSDSAVAAVPAANFKGLLVRDTTVADGLANAYKLVEVLDLGQF